MRRTFRQLAAVKPSRFLEAGTPTGLTGLLTHPAPRSTLLYLYSSTLDKLKSFPEDSLYRQSVEALTKQRLSIVESVVPEGYAAWAERAKKTIAEHPEVFNTPSGGVDHDSARHVKVTKNGSVFVAIKREKELDETSKAAEWDGEKDSPEFEGTRTQKEKGDLSVLGLERPGSDAKTVVWEQEPSLTVEQYVFSLPFSDAI
jgi:NADH dehydrogenase (ubiquinone) 1 alpha subcomplex subunit 5